MENNAMISVTDARQLVHSWLGGQIDVPKECVLTPGIERRNENGSWQFNLNFRHPEMGNRFFVMRFVVDAHGSIRILADFRKKLKEIIDAPEGLIREKRFYNALSVRTGTTPEWFVRVTRADQFNDRHGIDGHLHVRFRDQILRLPYQVKSSSTGERYFYDRYPGFRGIVKVFVIDTYVSEDALRHDVYDFMEHVYRKLESEESSVTSIRRRIARSVRNVMQI